MYRQVGVMCSSHEEVEFINDRMQRQNFCFFIFFVCCFYANDENKPLGVEAHLELHTCTNERKKHPSNLNEPKKEDFYNPCTPSFFRTRYHFPTVLTSYCTAYFLIETSHLPYNTNYIGLYKQLAARPECRDCY